MNYKKYRIDLKCRKYINYLLLNKMNYTCQPYEIQELKDPYKVDKQIDLNQVYELHKLH